jgi:F-type H+-transporting ATPase subunit delta
VRDTTVASRYAKALFLVTERRRETERALEDLKGAHTVLGPGAPVASYFASPKIRLTDKRHALRAAFEGRALPIIAVFVDLLMRKKRLGELPTIVTEFEDLVERSQGVRRAHVVSATPLAPAEIGRLVPELERITHGKIKLTTEVDPSLLGGALVRIGDRVIDRTVRSLLEAIEKQLVEASV